MTRAEYEIKLRDSFTQGLKSLEASMNRFEGKIEKINSAGNVFAGVFSANAVSAIAYRVGRFLGETTYQVVNLAGELEQVQIAFSTMLQSDGKANLLIKDLQNFAKDTPFDQRGVLSGARQMLAYGFEAEDMTKNMTMLGDVAAGLSIPLGDLVYLHGTLKAQGRAYQMDIRQLAMRGIPIYRYLAKVMGTTELALAGLISEGKVGFPEVEKAFIEMTKKGSQFGGLMERQSDSLKGRWSNFMDLLEITMADMGTKYIPMLKDALQTMQDYTEAAVEMDWSGLANEVTYLGDSFSHLWSALGRGDGSFVNSLDAFERMERFVRALNVSVRVLFTPFRAIIDIVTLAITGLTEIGDLLGKVLSGDNPRIAWRDFGKKFNATHAELIQKENEGWDKALESKRPWKPQFGGWLKGDMPIDKPLPGGKGGKGGAAATGSEDSSVGLSKLQSSTKNVVINIDKLVEQIQFTKTYEQSEAAMVAMVRKALVTAVNDVNLSV